MTQNTSKDKIEYKRENAVSSSCKIQTHILRKPEKTITLSSRTYKQNIKLSLPLGQTLKRENKKSQRENRII